MERSELNQKVYRLAKKNPDGSLKLIDLLMTRHDSKRFRPLLDSLGVFLIPTRDIIKPPVQLDMFIDGTGNQSREY